MVKQVNARRLTTEQTVSLGPLNRTTCPKGQSTGHTVFVALVQVTFNIELRHICTPKKPRNFQYATVCHR